MGGDLPSVLLNVLHKHVLLLQVGLEAGAIEHFHEAVEVDSVLLARFDLEYLDQVADIAVVHPWLWVLDDFLLRSAATCHFGFTI